MAPLSADVSDEELIALIYHWAALLEREDYMRAFAFTDPISGMGWTPELIREVIKSYGQAESGQRVTVDGVPTDISQRKAVDRWPTNDRGCFGQIRYDLNINGKASDLTAT